MAVFLGVDYGSKRVGLARANSQAKLATPIQTLNNDEQLWQKIAEIIKSAAVDKIVLGLPRGLDGQETEQTAKTRAFGATLAANTGLPVLLQDEAATTVTAMARGHKNDPDAAAATIILQDYIDNL